ncbi:Exodeoxyribonuclease VII small subunit [Deinococcus hopiensis KR-140]|uniref:Exodeoxyribonuclease VII small subunit n=2 Tax=Deinococcus TaxID=1298 RepID=A0A1W1V7Y2_9DEIO|nr:Exodeoxyribonuclease VII small subunit [Deinococcus hopiensis KR-140]
MSPSRVPEPMTYREAYARLSRIAAELEGGEADLDRVLPLLEEARAAYAACRERIEAVRAVLAGEWAEEEEADAAAPALEQAATDEGDSPF